MPAEHLEGRHDVAATDTFVSLGGDSLNYIECSLRLERVLGRLPADWHVMTLAELDTTTPRRPRSTLDTTVVMRAIGICAIVSTHMKLLYYPGGAHLMLALVGYNFSRFQLPIVAATERLRAGLRSVLRAAVPTMIWVAGGMVLVGGYSGATLALVNNYLGPPTHQNGRWHYWFIETFVQLTIAATVLVAIPVVRRFERRCTVPFRPRLGWSAVDVALPRLGDRGDRQLAVPDPRGGVVLRPRLARTPVAAAVATGTDERHLPPDDPRVVRPPRA